MKKSVLLCDNFDCQDQDTPVQANAPDRNVLGKNTLAKLLIITPMLSTDKIAVRSCSNNSNTRLPNGNSTNDAMTTQVVRVHESTSNYSNIGTSDENPCPSFDENSEITITSIDELPTKENLLKYLKASDDKFFKLIEGSEPQFVYDFVINNLKLFMLHDEFEKFATIVLENLNLSNLEKDRKIEKLKEDCGKWEDFSLKLEDEIKDLKKSLSDLKSKHEIESKDTTFSKLKKRIDDLKEAVKINTEKMDDVPQYSNFTKTAKKFKSMIFDTNGKGKGKGYVETGGRKFWVTTEKIDRQRFVTLEDTDLKSILENYDNLQEKVKKVNDWIKSNSSENEELQKCLSFYKTDFRKFTNLQKQLDESKKYRATLSEINLLKEVENLRERISDTRQKLHRSEAMRRYDQVHADIGKKLKAFGRKFGYHKVNFLHGDEAYVECIEKFIELLFKERRTLASEKKHYEDKWKACSEENADLKKELKIVQQFIDYSELRGLLDKTGTSNMLLLDFANILENIGVTSNFRKVFDKIEKMGNHVISCINSDFSGGTLKRIDGYFKDMMACFPNTIYDCVADNISEANRCLVEAREKIKSFVPRPEKVEVLEKIVETSSYSDVVESNLPEKKKVKIIRDDKTIVITPNPKSISKPKNSKISKKSKKSKKSRSPKKLKDSKKSVKSVKSATKSKNLTNFKKPKRKLKFVKFDDFEKKSKKSVESEIFVGTEKAQKSKKKNSKKSKGRKRIEDVKVVFDDKYLRRMMETTGFLESANNFSKELGACVDNKSKTKFCRQNMETYAYIKEHFNNSAFIILEHCKTDLLESINYVTNKNREEYLKEMKLEMVKEVPLKTIGKYENVKILDLDGFKNFNMTWGKLHEKMKILKDIYIKNLREANKGEKVKRLTFTTNPKVMCDHMDRIVAAIEILRNY